MATMDTITEYGPLDVSDVKSAIQGLAGTYLSRDIYAKYVEVARTAGRTPAHPRPVGGELARLGCISRKVRNQSAWFI